MSGYTAAAMAVASAVAGAYQAQQQQQTVNNNIARQNIINRNNAIAAQNEANFQAEVARNNAIIARDNAEAVRLRGISAEQDKALAGEKVAGAARARQAALGFLVDDTEDSTNVGLIGDLAEATQLDILRIRDHADLEARRAEVQGVNFIAQADLFQLKADSALSRVAQNQGGSPLAAGAGAFFSGASSAAALWPSK